LHNYAISFLYPWPALRTNYLIETTSNIQLFDVSAYVSSVYEVTIGLRSLQTH